MHALVSHYAHTYYTFTAPHTPPFHLPVITLGAAGGTEPGIPSRAVVQCRLCASCDDLDLTTHCLVA